MDNKTRNQLIEKYINGTASETELQQLLAWYRRVNEEEQIWYEDEHGSEAVVRERMLSSILQQMGETRSSAKPRIIPALLRAACIALVVGIGLWAYFQFSTGPIADEGQQRTLLMDIGPGGDKALLELANGEQIQLSGKGELINTNDRVLMNGKRIDKGIESPTNALNTLRTPIGGQFKVKLSDGTLVWLNAGSALRYPTSFGTGSREVELIGEAYFEVKHDSRRAFKVRTADQEIEVLGTAFNVSAYPRSAGETTLTQGKVRVRGQWAGRPAEVILKPAEQAYFDDQGLRSRTVDVNVSLAWKDGLFSFRKTDLKTIAQQLERWYDIKLVFKNKAISTRLVTGDIPRNVSLFDVVEILSYFDINCEIQGRTLYLDARK